MACKGQVFSLMGAVVGAVSVGVASGHYSTNELSAAGADHVLGTLEEPFPGM